jgi:acyl-CoA thioesterase-2
VNDVLADLVGLLDLEPIEVNIFRGRSPLESAQRVFGGQVAGQALVAAGRTVPTDRAVHSLHSYFLRPGDPSVPIVYEVDRIRDGRSFTTRRVVAIQHGEAIFNLAASFHREEPGVDHQVPMPDAPDPETLPTLADRLRPFRDQLPPHWARPRPIDVRYVDEPPWATGAARPRPPQQMVWMRAAGTLPDDPLVHVCVVTYASDMTLLDSVLLAHGLSWASGNVRGASLDHAMWFPPVPGRRVVALRAGVADGRWRPGAGEGAAVHPVRPTRRVGGTGGSDPRAGRFPGPALRPLNALPPAPAHTYAAGVGLSPRSQGGRDAKRARTDRSDRACPSASWRPAMTIDRFQPVPTAPRSTGPVTAAAELYMAGAAPGGAWSPPD